MKLIDALFKEPYLSYKVSDECLDDYDNYLNWVLTPLHGRTLSKVNVTGAFEGVFIVSGKVVTSEGAVQDCYLEVILPERISEYIYLKNDEKIIRHRGHNVGMGVAIPSISIEQFGNYKLFYAKHNPGCGIEVLKTGLKNANEKKDIALDLAYILRDEKKYPEAIEAFSIVLKANPEDPNIGYTYLERYVLYKAIGNLDKAEEDKLNWFINFEKQYGHTPTSQELKNTPFSNGF